MINDRDKDYWDPPRTIIIERPNRRHVEFLLVPLSKSLLASMMIVLGGYQ